RPQRAVLSAPPRLRRGRASPLGRDVDQVAKRAEPRERLPLELPHPLAGQVELAADRPERPRLALEPEAELEDPPRAFGQRAECESFCWRSTTCTGTRIVRAWFATARCTDWRIHHVAYVENLKPRRQSNFSTARLRPSVPSWIKSRNGTPSPR